MKKITIQDPEFAKIMEEIVKLVKNSSINPLLEVYANYNQPSGKDLDILAAEYNIKRKRYLFIFKESDKSFRKRIIGEI